MVRQERGEGGPLATDLNPHLACPPNIILGAELPAEEETLTNSPGDSCKLERELHATPRVRKDKK